MNSLILYSRHFITILFGFFVLFFILRPWEKQVLVFKDRILYQSRWKLVLYAGIVRIKISMQEFFYINKSEDYYFIFFLDFNQNKMYIWKFVYSITLSQWKYTISNDTFKNYDKKIHDRLLLLFLSRFL